MKRLYVLLFLLLWSCYCTVPAQWTQIPTATPLPISHLDFASATTGFITLSTYVSSIDPLWKTTDAGNSWNPVSYPVPVDHTSSLEALFFVDELVGYLHGQLFDTSMSFPVGPTFLYRTSDGGSSWTDVTPDTNLFFGRMAFNSAAEGIVAGTEVIWRTTDGGQTWTGTQLPNRGPMAIQLPSASVGFVSGFQITPATEAWMVKTTDSGQSWANVNVGGFGITYLREISFPTERIGVAAGDSPSGAKLICSFDSAMTWFDVPISMGICLGVHFPDSVNGLYLDVNGKVYRTTSGGQTWTQDFQVPGGGFLSGMNVQGNLAYVFGDSGMLYVSDVLTGVPRPARGPLAVFPNPVKAGATLHLPAGTGKVHWVFYDLQGRKLGEGNSSWDGEISVPEIAGGGVVVLDIWELGNLRGQCRVLLD